MYRAGVEAHYDHCANRCQTLIFMTLWFNDLPSIQGSQGVSSAMAKLKRAENTRRKAGIGKFKELESTDRRSAWILICESTCCKVVQSYQETRLAGRRPWCPGPRCRSGSSIARARAGSIGWSSNRSIPPMPHTEVWGLGTVISDQWSVTSDR